jgi:purine-binding chemotaxis protein CheW
MSRNVAKADVISAATQYVTVRIGGQLFGLPIASVHEVFVPDRITRVPLAPGEIEGVLNLRGRIVTTIDLRRLLGLPAPEATGRMAVGIEFKGESYGLLIDEVGEVMSLDSAEWEPNPANLDRRWNEVVSGVHRISGELMLILDVERALARVATELAA